MDNTLREITNTIHSLKSILTITIPIQLKKPNTNTFNQPIPILGLGLDSCVARCAETCPDNDLKNGCNNQYSCAHACKIRDLGETEFSCKEKCLRIHPDSSCYPVINGYQFNLCVSCQNRKPHVANPPGQCAHVWLEYQKRIDECKSGCSFYGSGRVNLFYYI